MEQDRSDFLPVEITLSELAAWSDILPAGSRVLGASLFADVFLADATGAVYMLEVSAGSIERIAASEGAFREHCVEDADGWLLRALVDRCRSAGLILGPSQCYAFTTLPLFGGEYTVDNVWMCSCRDWIAFTAMMYSKTKDLPDGSTVRIVVAD
ncbi:T6SS immunity protein Tdi1 domain-containing protein [Bradyrhizobium tropiciagri]|uniref:T6SS immunity protein Tdi1 domain-containing protein n=1 Tax=Bradyrhizobium tropiciagri TaxID=312253 RepID=UPI00067BE685|nr:T6SS immunity protein Tdi1 domain-containing protein [Bradyrhizobium tropiciagri]